MSQSQVICMRMHKARFNAKREERSDGRAKEIVADDKFVTICSSRLIAFAFALILRCTAQNHHDLLVF